jgi:hypothetical protein
MSDQVATLEQLVDANCRAGDLMSCRALPGNTATDSQFPDSPGVAGRSFACNHPEEVHCDRALLHRECERGFPASCDAEVDTHGVAGAARKARILSLATTGCAAGIVSECRLALRTDDPEEELKTLERACDLDFVVCDVVASKYLARHEPSRARDFMERTCQFAPGAEGACAQLGAMYLAHTLQEPIPGRGQALVDWGCAETLKQYGPEMVDQEVCKLAHPR